MNFKGFIRFHFKIALQCTLFISVLFLGDILLLVNSQCIKCLELGDQCSLDTSYITPVGSIQSRCPSNSKCYQNPDELVPPTCLIGVPINGSCKSDDQCDYFLACINNTCLPIQYLGFGEKCSMDSECVESLFCVNDVCTNIDYPVCTSSVECKPGEHCYQGLCQPALKNGMLCNNTAQCRYLSVCQDPNVPNSVFDYYGRPKYCLPPFSQKEGDICDVGTDFGCNIDEDLACYSLSCSKTHRGNENNCNDARAPMDKCMFNKVCQCTIVNETTISDLSIVNTGVCHNIYNFTKPIGEIALEFQECYYSSGCPSVDPLGPYTCVYQKCGNSIIDFVNGNINTPCAAAITDDLTKFISPEPTPPVLTFLPFKPIPPINDDKIDDKVNDTSDSNSEFIQGFNKVVLAVSLILFTTTILIV